MTITEIIKSLPGPLGIALLLVVAFGVGYVSVTAYVEKKLLALEVKFNKRIAELERSKGEGHARALEGLTLDLTDPNYAIKARSLFYRIADHLG